MSTSTFPRRHAALPRFAGCAILLALLAGACASPGASARKEREARELADARRATHEKHWKDAAGLWHEIFLRSDEHSREACAETSRALIELGDPASAQHLVELGLRTFANDAELHELRAKSLAAQGLRNAAETAYESSLEHAPGEPRVVLALAELRCDLGRHADALKLLEPRIESGKGAAAEFALAARAYRALHRPGDAFLSLERAFSRGAPALQQLLDAASMYGDEWVRNRDARAAALAAEWASRALAIDPQATEAHVILGMVAEDASQDTQAAEHYRRAVETDPACVVALGALAAVQARRGQIEDSKAMAERALVLEKDPAKRAELEKLAHPPPPGG